MKSPSEIQRLAKLLGGVPILGIFPGSPAEQVGLMYGDIVLSVNGHDTKSFEDFLRAHTGKETSVKLQIFRDGRNLTFEISFRQEDWVEAEDDLEEPELLSPMAYASPTRASGLC
ncbi:MAG TPA: PDZ domain-containing protein [Polyangiaceae bacterium]|nr:PDZ domain-containing protein [Polyangiaceae bacterium]